jgi:hypothetical protein
MQKTTREKKKDTAKEKESKEQRRVDSDKLVDAQENAFKTASVLLISKRLFTIRVGERVRVVRNSATDDVIDDMRVDQGGDEPAAAAASDDNHDDASNTPSTSSATTRPTTRRPRATLNTLVGRNADIVEVEKIRSRTAIELAKIGAQRDVNRDNASANVAGVVAQRVMEGLPALMANMQAQLQAQLLQAQLQAQAQLQTTAGQQGVQAPPGAHAVAFMPPTQPVSNGASSSGAATSTMTTTTSTASTNV